MGDIGFDYVEDRTRRREERRRRRAEEKARELEALKNQEETVKTVTVTSTCTTSIRSIHKSSAEIEISLEMSDQSSEEDASVGSSNLKKTPIKMSKEYSVDKQEVNEAERKAEEIRLKREREQEERYREKMEELQLSRQRGEQERLEMEERKERRRLKQEAEELRLRQEQEEREAREVEEAKRIREEIQKRRQEAEERRRNIQNSLSYVRPDSSITDNAVPVEKIMSKEERTAHKQRTLDERIEPLRIPSRNVGKLRELALDLQEKLVELYGLNFDLMKRKQRQEYDLNELQSRIADLTKVTVPKKSIVVTVDSGHVSKIKEKGFFLEDKPVKKSFLQERNEGIAASGGVQGRLSMFQNKADNSIDQPDIKRSGRSTWKAPEYDKCNVCNKNVYSLERLEVAKKLYHKQCFKCEYCKKVTSTANYAIFQDKIYCKQHQLKVERESLQQGVGGRH